MKKNHRIPAPYIFLLFLLAGCATVQGDWDKAQKSDTVYAYKAFRGNHPNSEFDARARTRIEEIEWANALKKGDVIAYATFKHRYPNSPHAKEAEARIADLEWASAKRRNSEDSYSSFLKRFPASPNADEAGKRLRERKYERAKKADSVAYIEEFLKAYPQGDDSETLRRKLPALRVWEPRKTLAERIIRLRPKTTFTMKEMMEGKVGAQPETYKADLAEIRSLLEHGVDPNTVRIDGWAPARETQGISFIRGNPVITREYKVGSPGYPVPYDKPGMTLLEYCKTNGLTEAYEILKSHGAK